MKIQILLERGVPTKKNKFILTYEMLLLEDIVKRNKFNDKSLILVHCSNKGYSSTYNILPFYAVYLQFIILMH